MGPDRNSYEIWLIDYLDGALDKERTDLLFAFLEENPDIKEEFADITSLSLKPDSGNFRNREKLIRVAADMGQQQFELLCVAELENDLGTDQKRDLEELISSDPEKRKIYDLFLKIKLSAPTDTFRYKYKLRKLTATQRIFRYSFTLVSTAAAVLVMIMVLKRPDAVPGTETVAFNRITPPVITGTSSQKHDLEKAGPRTIQVGRAIAVNTTSPGYQGKSDENIQPVAVTVSKDSLTREIIRNNIVKVSFSDEGLKRANTGLSLAEIKISQVDEKSDPQGNGPGQFIEKLFREKVIKPKETNKGSLRAYDVADAGVKGLKKLFGWDMSLQKNRDENGDVKSVRFSSKLISFNAPVKKGTRLP